MGAGPTVTAPYVTPELKDEVAKKHPEYALLSYTGDNYINLMVRQKHEPYGDNIGLVTLQKTAALPYLLSTKLYVDPRFRGTNVSDVLDSMKVAVVKSSNRIGLMAAVHSDNLPELARLFKRGWRCVHYNKERYVFVLDV
jgi:predicted RNase H-like nuclease